MPTRSNEQLCRLAQKGDTTARDILLEKNLGFIRKIALEQYRNMGLDENDIGIDLDDLMQEGSIGLLNAIPFFDAGSGCYFLLLRVFPAPHPCRFWHSDRFWYPYYFCFLPSMES